MYVDTDTLVLAKLFLEDKTKCSTRTLRQEFDISGHKAGYIFRVLGWIKYGAKGSTCAKYKRP